MLHPISRTSRASLLVAPVLLLALAAYRLPDETSSTAPKPARIRVHGNTTAAGTLRNGELTLRIEAKVGQWHPNGEDKPGAPIQAFGEIGKSLQIPGPMIRVPAGTRVTMSIRNSLSDSALIVHGLHDRPFTEVDSIEIRPGETREVRFRLDAPGTYYYWATSMHRPLNFRTKLDSQLSGAIIVDGPGESASRDRVLVIGHWGDTVGGAPLREGGRDLLVINGRSWPATERFKYLQGDTIRWRIINASSDIHPMHLHGFYFNVERRGDSRVDTALAESRRPLVYTEFMRRGTTMSMSWVPYRAGNWLFHCHIPSHFDYRKPLGIIVREQNRGPDHIAHGNHALEGMTGLIMGVHVMPDPKKREAANGTARQAERQLRLLVRPNPGGKSDSPGYAYTLVENASDAPIDGTMRAGPAIIVQRNQPTAITVVNRLTEPTAVHWHGMELESYFDGVAGFSGAGRQITPAIAPGDSFVARFTPPRAGTFMYHSHVSEPRQLRGGLGGALIVVDSLQRFDPTVDFPMVLTTPKDSVDRADAKTLLNGRLDPAPIPLRVGGVYRFRFINITTDRPGSRLELRRDTTIAEWKIVAKDGVDRAPQQRQLSRAVLPISIGEAYDIEIAPTDPGRLAIQFVANNGRTLVDVPLEVSP